MPKNDEAFSLRKNFAYMARVFYKPKSVIDAFLGGIPSLYSIVPLAIFTILFEISYILDYLYHPSSFSFHLLGDILGISTAQYDLIQVFIFPIVHILDFFVFGGLIYALSKSAKPFKIETQRTVLFFMFIWNTIGLLGFVTESLGIWFGLDFILYLTQPAYLIAWILYLAVFISQQVEITKWKSAGISITSVVMFLAFRMLFLG